MSKGKKQVYAGREYDVFHMHNKGMTYKEIAEELGGSPGGAIEANKRYMAEVQDIAPVAAALTDPKATKRTKNLIRTVEETNTKRDELITLIDKIKKHYESKFDNPKDIMSEEDMKNLFRAIDTTNKVLRSIDKSLEVNLQFINQGTIHTGNIITKETKEDHERELYRARQEANLISERFIRDQGLWEEYAEFLNYDAGMVLSEEKKKIVDVDYEDV